MCSRPTALALAIAGIVSMGPAFGQDVPPPPAAELEGVKVVGDWLGDAARNTVVDHPGARTVVRREELREAGAINLRDALRRIPGVQVQESNGTGGSDVSLNVGVRGLTSRLSPRSTILLDGVPIAVAPYGQPQVSMAPVGLGNIEAVDVVRGGGSVRYGPQNVGGIINFVTREIPETFGGSAGVQFQGAEHGGIRTNTNAFLGGTASNGLGVALLYNGLHGPGFREHEDNESIDDVMLKAKYAITAEDTLTGSIHHYDGQAGMPGGLTQADYDADPFQSRRPFDDFHGRRTDYVLKYSHVDDRRSFEVQSYYSDSFRGSHIETITQGANGSYTHQLNAYPRNYHVFAIEPRYSQLFDWGQVTHEIGVGYRYTREAMHERTLRNNKFVSNLPYTPYDSFPYDGPYVLSGNNTGSNEAHAVYVDDTINAGNWTITPGIRYERIDSEWQAHPGKTVVVKGPTERQKSYSKPLPALNVIYHVTDALRLYANAETSFGSLQYFQIGQKDSTNQFAAGLKPETARTYEIGTRYETKAWGGEVTLFRINFDHELQLVGKLPGVPDSYDGWTTLGATTHKGVESAAHVDLGAFSDALQGFTLWGTATYTHAFYRHGSFEGRDLPFYSRRTANLGLRYGVAAWTFNLDAFSQSRQHSPGSPSFDPARPTEYVTEPSPEGDLGDIPGWTTWNARAEYAFGPSLSNLRLGAGVKNLADKRYFTRSTDNNDGIYVGMPRTWFVQASVDF
ncbi:TonB-dependent siderophore receptor [Luteibacter jiangsuensis]|uniref:TonB-dependent siderophore receptor n=1 Tax=Luteibacter jiangsuensis TaxID=637577 RepID=A0ABX0Q761_9GAMM|nr:TonB-dependent siderophore receptor [Luteibacter jiangsuensis]NID06383.1 TonB-dependent siderophore receptor [Luteibacter jiangsuensis]